MTTNLSQAFLEGSGMVSSLVQELASGNFNEGRESFHEYVYSKLFYADDRGDNPSEIKPSASVFLSSDLTSDSAGSVAVLNSSYIHGTNHTDRTVEADSVVRSKTPKSPPLLKNSTTPKLESSKKSVQIPPAHSAAVLQASSGGSDGLTKKKKKNQFKKKEKSHVCEVCGRGFAEKYTLNRHMLTHTHIKPYSCSKCNMSFSRSDGLAKHMAAGHRRVDSHHCDVCGGTFNSELSFEQHRREYGNTLPFVCNLCMLAFSQCCHLNYHMKSHSLSKMNDNFSYDGQDNKNAIDVSELIPEDFSPPKKEENKFFTGELVNNFVNAARGLNSEHMLDPNIVVKPEIEDFPNSCSANSKLYENSHRSDAVNTVDALKNVALMTSASPDLASSVGNHIASNLVASNSAGNSSYLPDTSKKFSFSNSNMNLDSEMKKYYDIKIPNPKFLENSSLSVATMGQDGLFRCEVCGKGFTRKYHMQRHVKLHTRGPVPRAHLLDWTRRPYACGVCKMGFTRQHHLTRHILIHTGERPHSCHICGRAFRRYTNLSLHIRTVHEAERPFKCSICGRGFPRLYSLQRHLKLHAKNAYLLNSGSNEHIYTGFKAVGTVDVDNRKSPVCSQSSNAISIQHSPRNSQEPVESNLHGDGEKSNQRSNLQGHADSGSGENQRVSQETYSFLQDGSLICFQSRNDQRSQNTDQARNCLPSQIEEIHVESGTVRRQVVSPAESDVRVQQNRRGSSDIENIKLQNSVHTLASTDFPSSSHHADVGRNKILVQSRSITDYNPQQSLQNTNGERLISAGSMTNQNMAILDIAGGHFHNLDMTESNYQQRDGGEDGFTIHQQQIQNSLPMMALLEQHGSHSMVNQATHFDTYHLPASSYVQALPSIQIQHRSNMNLPTRKTSSPTNVKDGVSYSHNNHVDIAVQQSSISNSAVYSQNHNANSVPFQFSDLGMYQQLLSDSLPQMDNHPHPSSSPMPVIPHNNMQY